MSSPSLEQPAAAPETFDFGKKKKKGKKSGPSGDSTLHMPPAAPEAEEGLVDGSGLPFYRGQLPPYQDMLMELMEAVHDHNPELQGAKKYTIRPPTASRVGSRRTAWTNFSSICELLDREEEHVFQFVLSELGTEGSISKTCLTLRGRYNTKHFESLLRKYITEYVTCHMCKSGKTKLKRDPSTRLFENRCSAC
eukprot:Polyplicarium_translucidae@DN1658_c0_g1_i2.p1